MSTNVPILDDAITKLMNLDSASVLALADLAIERLRQVEQEGWTPEHDDKHYSGEMAAAAACYALAPHTTKGSRVSPPNDWPWHRSWWKPKSAHRNRVRAGALIVAELARHLRSAGKAQP